MFTGIIQSTGRVVRIDYNDNKYEIITKLSLENCKIGSSISCDGVCLTLISIIREGSNYIFEVNIGEETIKRSNLVNWKIEDKINIEKSLRVGDEIAGHFVYGHVDTTLKIKKIINLQNSWEFEFIFTMLDNLNDFKKYIAEKGSISINGISLTVANVFENSFKVSIIPHTFKTTTLSLLNVGDIVNIEFDPLARYINNEYGK